MLDTGASSEEGAYTQSKKGPAVSEIIVVRNREGGHEGRFVVFDARLV
jgi:hypothetical protein